MIDNLKLGFRLMKYGYGKKRFYSFAILFFVCAIIFIIPSSMLKNSKSMILCGSMYFSMDSILVMSVYDGLFSTKFINLSAYKRKLETKVSSTIATLISVICYIFSLITLYIKNNFFEMLNNNFLNGIILVSACYIGLLLMFGAARMKSFILSTIVYMLASFAMIIFVFNGKNYDSFLEVNKFYFNPIISVIVGFIMILGFGYVRYCISRFLYKKDFDRKVFDKDLRIKMK